MFSKVNQMQQNNQQSPQSSALKRKHEEDVVEETNSKKKSSATLCMFREFDDTPTTIVLDSDRKIPKLVLASKPDSKYVLQLNTPVLTVQFSKLGEFGNSGEFGKTDDDFEFEMKTVTTLNERVARAMPDEVGRGEAFSKFIRTTTDKLMEFAYNTKGCMESHKKKADKAAKKKGKTGLELFKEGAILSQFKDYEHRDSGVEVEMFQCKRKGAYEGISQRPVFWKSTRDGYQIQDVKYLTYGTAVKYQVGFKFWENASKYGISCTLGKNIIVVFQPKNESGPKESQGAPQVPYDI
jgi:hypothetical protein